MDAGSVFGLLVVFCFYFTPLIIALIRRKQNYVAIGVTNFLVGWTLIGWVISLIWSLTKDSRVSN